VEQVALRIQDLLEEKFEEPDWQDCFVVDIKQHPNNKVEVFMDSDTGVTFEKCRKISRFLENIIDTEGWLGEKYTLEVSSPGVNRPLKLWRQYPKNIGRKLDIVLEDGDKKTGLLKEVHDSEIVLEEKVRIKEGKRKKTMKKETEIPFDFIKKAVVKVSFNK